MIKNYTDVFDYITTQEANYKRPIPLNDTWDWCMYDHIKTSDLYNNSQLLTGKSDFKPVKNITRPILNLQYRTEDIELKDVQIYVDDPDKYHLSFLVKKYHDDVFVQENDLDTYFDSLNISRILFGGGLSKQLNRPCPEVVPLQTIAFCDQTDILSAPLGIRHYYSPDQLMEMEKFGWGNEANGATITIKDLIALSKEEKGNEGSDDRTKKTPGRYVEVFEVHGNLPKRFANPMDTSEEYETRIYIVAFYQKKNSSDKQGVILYTALEKESPFKLIKRDPVFGRALGFGGAEELFEPQVWVNYDMIRMQDMLDAASKTILKATGANSSILAKKQKVRDLSNLEILDVGDGDLGQVDTFPRNMQLFDQSVERWEAHAQQMGAANDSIMGVSPSSGTPFKLQELVTQESRGLHEYRRGIFAKHIEEIYRDWIIPHIQREITKGYKFLSELSLDEIQYVAKCVATAEANKRIKEAVLAGKVVTPEEQKALTDTIMQGFKEKGNKHFIEILKGEFKDTPLAVKVSVKGKSKNLDAIVDKLSNVFSKIFANPAGFITVMKIPAAAKAFNEMIEKSGLNPGDFSDMEEAMKYIQEQQAQPSPIQPQVAEPTYG